MFEAFNFLIFFVVYLSGISAYCSGSEQRLQAPFLFWLFILEVLMIFFYLFIDSCMYLIKHVWVRIFFISLSDTGKNNIFLLK